MQMRRRRQGGIYLTQHICDEDTVELGLFERFGQLNPVLSAVKAPRLIVRVPPEPRGLMSAACQLDFPSSAPEPLLAERGGV
jgi:hypothetical protein